MLLQLSDFLTAIKKGQRDGQRFVWEGEKANSGFLSGYGKHEASSVNGSSFFKADNDHSSVNIADVGCK